MTNTVDIARREAFPDVAKLRRELAAGNFDRAYNRYSTGVGRGGFYSSKRFGEVFGLLPTDEEYAASKALDEAHKAMMDTLRPVADGESEPDPVAINAAVDAWADALDLHKSGNAAYVGRVNKAISSANKRIARGETPLPVPADEITATFQRLGIDPDPDAERDYYSDEVFRAAEGIRKHEELQRQVAELSDPEHVKAVQQRDKRLAAARKAFEAADEGNGYISQRESRWADYLAANHPELEAVQCEPTFDGGALWKTLRSNARDQKAAKPKKYFTGIFAEYDAPHRSFIRCDRIGEVMAMHQKPDSPAQFSRGHSPGMFQVTKIEPTLYLRGGKTYQVVQFSPMGRRTPANATYTWSESVHKAIERAASSQGKTD